jgi:hypothetical protein
MQLLFLKLLSKWRLCLTDILPLESLVTFLLSPLIITVLKLLGFRYLINLDFFLFLLLYRSDAQRAAKQKEAKERELEHASFSADRIEEGGFPQVSMVSLSKKVTSSHISPISYN